MLKEFKQFLLRGNVIDLAVGVVMGASFGSLVNILVSGILTPLISVLIRTPDFSWFTFTINDSQFLIGQFLNTLISFVLVSAAIFFFVIKPMNLLVSRSRKAPPADPTTKQCKECLSVIPLEAKRCSHCTQIVA